MEPRQQQFAIWYFIIAFLVILTLQNFVFAPHTENLSYSSFKALLEDVAIGERTISGTLRNEELEQLLPPEEIAELKKLEAGLPPLVTVRVDDPDLVKQLEAARVCFVGRIDSTWMGTLLLLILPAVIFFALWGLLMKRMGGAGGGMIVQAAFERATQLLTLHASTWSRGPVCCCRRRLWASRS